MTNEFIPLPCPFCGGNRIKVGRHFVRNEGSGRVIFNVRDLDCGVNLFGGGSLISERAAAERAAAERAVLSDRERAMQQALGQ